MKRHSFLEFIERENNELCKIIQWLAGMPLRLMRRMLLTSLLLAVLFYLIVVLPVAVARLAVVYHALP